ncbi:MAG: glycerol dehydrogenase [Pseudomonadales bacterium]|nr:glycerol dehydrogenase [Pseudomonadales bacterium]
MIIRVFTTMHSPTPYYPHPIYSDAGPAAQVPRAFISPGSYIQGPGVLANIGRYMAITGTQHPWVMLSTGGERRFGELLSKSFADAGIEWQRVIFDGECSIEEITRIAGQIGEAEEPCDLLIALGGGKCCDAAKGIAWRLGVPCAICPTLASTDAPCSAVSVIYTPEGKMVSAEFYPRNPALVVVDSDIVAHAPVRYLVAGIGDALATWYEARTCFANPKGSSTLGSRTSLAANAISELCASTIYEHAESAIAAVRAQEVTPSLEHVIEANTLLSGIGFESGGLAAAHALASALTAVPEIEAQNLHGEMVAIGLLTQLVIEQDEPSWQQVASLFARIGLPIHLGQLGLDTVSDDDKLALVAKIASRSPLIRNEPVEIDADSLKAAMLSAHQLGTELATKLGDVAWQSLR